jgi:glycosyltransferase involved in cell wall biosynthesis
MIIAGVTRIRNEEHIIEDTLDHYAQFCNGGIFVLDEASTDNTSEICACHPAVGRDHLIQLEAIVEGPNERRAFETWGRQQPLELARKIAKPDWVFYFDADERVTLDTWIMALPGIDVYFSRLWDFYITPDDVGKDWTSRQWIGPEYRDIVMFWRDQPGITFREREPSLPGEYKKGRGGDVRHYGKAISVMHWEETCHYYATKQPEPFSSKWVRRHGYAIHTRSSFDNELILWTERNERGFPLTPQIEQRSVYPS